MGKYVDVINEVRLPVVGKADFILQNVSGSIELPNAPESYIPDKIVVVVHNAKSPFGLAFDAAAFAFNEAEFDYFKEYEKTDKRGKYRWLIVPGADEIAF